MLTHAEAINGFRQLLHALGDSGILRKLPWELYEEASLVQLCYLDQKNKPRWMNICIHLQNKINSTYLFKIEILNKRMNAIILQLTDVNDVINHVKSELLASNGPCNWDEFL